MQIIGADCRSGRLGAGRDLLADTLLAAGAADFGGDLLDDYRHAATLDVTVALPGLVAACLQITHVMTHSP